MKSLETEFNWKNILLYSHIRGQTTFKLLCKFWRCDITFFFSLIYLKHIFLKKFQDVLIVSGIRANMKGVVEQKKKKNPLTFTNGKSLF